MIHSRTLEDDSVLPHSGSENFKNDYGTKLLIQAQIKENTKPKIP